MKSCVYIFFFILFSNAAVSETFYEITNSGRFYSWYSKSDARDKYLDKHLSYVDLEEREKLRKLKISPYYSPTNGDVGILVSLLKNKYGDKFYILNVAGNHILINSKGAKKVDNKKI